MGATTNLIITVEDYSKCSISLRDAKSTTVVIRYATEDFVMFITPSLRQSVRIVIVVASSRIRSAEWLVYVCRH